MTDFIDRAKLEAEAEKRWPLWLPTGDYEIDREDYSETDAKWQNAETEEQRQSFLAGAAAYAALLDAETTEEWGTWSPRFREFLPFSESRERAERHAVETGEKIGVRRVARSPWLPAEGGEKP